MNFDFPGSGLKRLYLKIILVQTEKDCDQAETCYNSMRIIILVRLIKKDSILRKGDFMIKSKRYILFSVLAVAVAAVVFGVVYFRRQTQEQDPITATALKLNTVITITIYDSQDQSILDDAMALCDEYEQIFSRTSEESELYQLNAGELADADGISTVSDSLSDLIATGLSYAALSEGAFDISIAPVSSLWDFTSGEGTVPDQAEVEAAVELVDYRQVFQDGNQIHFGMDGMELDLGAVAKGYIADRLKEFLVSRGVESAIIDLGGNVLCVGERPDGTPFRIGIQRPFADRNETLAAVEISGKSVVSSGIYERYFEQDGVLYHHILNPKTGYPYDNGLTSVTIISEQSVDGDGLSTTAFALGLEKGLELINSLPDVQAIFITEDGELHFSENFEDEVSISYME